MTNGWKVTIRFDDQHVLTTTLADLEDACKLVRDYPHAQYIYMEKVDEL